VSADVVGQILLVEDDEPLELAIARHLRARGHAVRVAQSAEEARAVLASAARPSIVILDINLPGETGWSLLRGHEYEAAGRPPVVVVTATHVHSSWLREYRVAGYLPKPFALETLVEIVERTMSRQDASGETVGEGGIERV
jgi:DNA-binding response OmpR family regulator